jgi:hypothetical protein
LPFSARSGAASVQRGKAVTLLGGSVQVDVSARAPAVPAASVQFDLHTQTFAAVADAAQLGDAGQTAVQLGDATFLFGGAHSAAVTKLVDGKPTRLPHAAGKAPAPRLGHSAVEFGGKMFVLGGARGGVDADADAELWQFDLRAHAWKLLSAAAPVGKLSYHSAVVRDGVMWVFGGRDAAGVARNAVWSYDLANGDWVEGEQLASGGPSARYAHSACVAGDELLVFGGVARDGAFASDVWALQLNAAARALPTWTRAAVLDEASAPAARAHASCAVYDHALWIFGGRDATQTYQDVWALDLEYLQWELIACFPGVTFPHCKAAAIRMSPPAHEALTSFKFVNPGVSAAEYTVALHSAPTAPVHIVPRVDASHVQVTPSELVFDETNWHVPQTVRVLVLEDLFLPGDATAVAIEHETRTADEQYARAPLGKRAIVLPSLCGDGRCMGDESHSTCALDCRNVGTATAPFCGDGLCMDETYESCREDCAVQGSDNSCPEAHPVRCRTGECVAHHGACAVRSRSTSRTCDADRQCRGAVLTCHDGSVLCPDGSCAESSGKCAQLPVCEHVHQRRCFDTSCARDCGLADGRCPPARRNLDLASSHCESDPARGHVTTVEDAHRAGATLSTIHRPAHSTSRLYLRTTDDKYYGQISFPGGAFTSPGASTCPCHEAPLAPGAHDPFVGVFTTPVDDAHLPAGGFGGFDIAIEGHESITFSPFLASVWVAHHKVAKGYCLARYNADGVCARTGRKGTWDCVDSELETSSANADCECEMKHTRGYFSHGNGRYAFIPAPVEEHHEDACDGYAKENREYIEGLLKEVKVPKSGVECPSSPFH